MTSGGAAVEMKDDDAPGAAGLARRRHSASWEVMEEAGAARKLSDDAFDPPSSRDK